MTILISGICGFVGSILARELRDQRESIEIVGFDNFIRPGSETNRREMKRRGVTVLHADTRSQTDIDALPEADWVIDAAANPSVLAGIDGKSSSRQVVEHNLLGTVNLLEYCKAHRAGFALLSTSRVYSIPGLSGLQMVLEESGDRKGAAFVPRPEQAFPDGITVHGVSERYSTAAPVSLYGSTKLASETLALEYGEAFDLPVWINRCGVLAGAGQFGRPDQGIFAFWINGWLRESPLRYIGFGGRGHQVRDCLHPRDLVPLLLRQIDEPRGSSKPRIMNFSGGVANSVSLAQLSEWCKGHFGPGPSTLDPRISAPSAPRPYDIPWMVLDSGCAREAWNWAPTTGIGDILDEIARHAKDQPDWLEISAP